MDNHYFNPDIEHFFPDKMKNCVIHSNDNQAPYDPEEARYDFNVSAYELIVLTIEQLFKDILELPDYVAIKALEKLTTTHAETIITIKEKIYDQ